MNRKELIEKFVEFFRKKSHSEIRNSSLIPENDPTVLFTTAGMQPIVPFLLGEKHPQGKRLVNYQRCIRTGDIDVVGDDFHLTFFEMLGNWSLGDYFKKESIEWSYEFLTKILKIEKEKIAVTCFEGDKTSEKDTEAEKIWLSLGITKERIAFLSKEDNWWGPAGKTGPCGPDTEIFYWVGKGTPKGNPKTNKKDWCEIWNNVFMQYVKNETGKYVLAKQKNVDTGMGVERMITIFLKEKSVYSTPLFKPIIKKIEEISKQKNLTENISARIIADHIKAACFILGDGVIPSNTERGYVLRRLIRRAVKCGRDLGINENFTKEIAKSIFPIYSDYPSIELNTKNILEELEKEEIKFRSTLEKGIKEFEKITENKKTLSGKEAFLLYQSYGFPIEITQELCKEKNLKLDLTGFEEENRKHQELSKTASAGVFKSGLADCSEKTTKMHTATHLLLAALKIVLKNKDIIQRGANITPERIRFDFSFPRKLTDEELKNIEDLVNAQIQQACEVEKQEMTLEEARKKGATGIFESKYGERVYVYTIAGFSKEICSGPHVKNTCEIGRFKITKEESSSAGVRRIKAELI